MKKNYSNGKTVVFRADFSTVNNCEKSFNAVSHNGSLISVPALEKTDSGYVYFPCGDFILSFNEQGVYSRSGNVRKKVGEVVEKRPCLLFVEQIQKVFVSGEEGTFVCDGNGFEKIFEVHFAKMAFSHERLFGVSNGTLYFTARDDFSVWKTVQTAGVSSVCVAKDVFAIGNDVVKVDFSDSEVDAKILPIFRNVGTVQPRSVSVFGNKIFFATEGEVKVFDGIKCQTVAKDYCFNDSFGIVVGGKYLVTATDGGTDCVLVFDGETEKMQCVLDICANIICGGDMPYFCTDNGVFVFGESCADLFWQSYETDMGTSSKKYLRKLVVDTEFPVAVHVVTERDSKIYHFDGAPHPQSVCIGGYFRKMHVMLFGQGQAKINNLQVVAQTFESGVSV